MDYVPGVGLLGMTIDTIFRIDPSTGAATPRTAIRWQMPPGGSRLVRDFAWDAATRTLITTFSENGYWWDLTSSTWVYRIDPDSGLATLLTDSAPAGLVGVARVETPEPGTWVAGCTALGLLGFAATKRRQPHLWYL